MGSCIAYWVTVASDRALELKEKLLVVAISPEAAVAAARATGNGDVVELLEIGIVDVMADEEHLAS